MTDDKGLRRTVKFVAILNLAYFGIEFAVAHAIGSVALFAGSVSFLEDAAINFLILIASGWGTPRRVRLGMALDVILIVPGLAVFWTSWQKFSMPVPPEPIPLLLVGVGALVVNFSCAILLARYRKRSGSMASKAFFPPFNDVMANTAIIGAGLLTIYTHAAWPDLILGAGIAFMNANAIKKVYKAARDEQSQRSPLNL